MTQDPTQAPEWLLNYYNCSVEELRAFIENRTGAAVGEKGILAAHLRKMDQTSTFPRFMELPSELRINIYEALLVDYRARDERGWLLDNNDCKLHTAVLRTSKQIYSEARPVLYGKNKFSVIIGHTWKVPRNPRFKWVGLRVVRPGAKFSYHRTIAWNECPTVEHCLIGCPILRGLKHLTVDLELESSLDDSDDSDDGDDGDRPYTYLAPACRGITAVCLALAGASRMEQLTIRVTVIDPQASEADLAKVLWPLIFLRSDIVVRVEGVSEVLRRETSAEYAKRARQRALLSHRQKMAFAGLVAEVRSVRKRCAENDEYDNDIMELAGNMKDIMKLLDKLTSLGVWLDLTDIVTSTSKWTTLQRNADTFEGLIVPRRGHSGLRELSRT